MGSNKLATPNVTLKQFRYLVALADQQHFRRAAEVCGISQPSLSAQVQNLEEVLGSRLVERGRGGVTLTPIGREVVARARALLIDAQAITEFATTAQHGLAGTIRLGIKATLGPYLMPRVVSTIHRARPEFKLYIREGVPAQLETELISGLHDVILAQLPVQSVDLVTQKLFREPILLAVSSEHHLASKDHVTTHDLRGLSVLSLAPDFHLHDQVHSLCDDYGAHVIRDYEGTSLYALRQMVAMNMGATFLPALYVKSEIAKDSDVVALPLKGRSLTRSIGLVWRRGAGRSPAFNDLADFIRTVVRREFDKLILET